jgi:hypothetical protein
MKLSKWISVWIFSAVIFALAGCSLFKAPLVEPKTLEGSQAEEVLAYATPKADNLIKGLVEGDYAVFSADFDETMKNGMNQAAFDELRQMFADKLGSYESHEVSIVLEDELYTTVAYKMIFEKDNAVVMRVVFDNQAPHQITGLWFDSPELRK